MTTAIRDLTPFESNRLDNLRVQFSGRTDVDALLAEVEQDFRSQPVPPACPSWCDHATGHVYELADGDTEATRTEMSRFHEQGVGDHLTVSQLETVSTSDGSVTRGTPYVLVNADGLELDLAQTERLGACAAAAATLLREIVGAA